MKRKLPHQKHYDDAYQSALRLVKWSPDEQATARAVVRELRAEVDELKGKIDRASSFRAQQRYVGALRRAEAKLWGFIEGYRRATGRDLSLSEGDQ